MTGFTAGFTYNTRGQVLTHTDPLGKVTRYGYDSATEELLSATEDYGHPGCRSLPCL